MARESTSKMAAEALREIGVLIFVFAMLDKLVSGRITTLWTLATGVVSSIFFLSGIYIERRRRDE
jgi:hypothetical protein